MARSRALVISVFFLMVLFALYGCGSGNGNTPGSSTATGSVAFQIDLARLSTSSSRAVAHVLKSAPSITAVTATLSGEHFGPTTYDLTVSGGTATGRIDNLPSGLMHVALNAYGGSDLLYTGSTDVRVVSGAEAKAQVLLDPVNNGSVSIDVGLNPFPGFKALNQSVGAAYFHDSTGAKTYLFDNATASLAVYDAEMTTNLKNLALPVGVGALALSTDGKHMFVGCAGGQIYKVDTASGATDLVVNITNQVRGVSTINGKYLLVAGDLPSNKTHFVVIDVITGTITATYDYDYYIYGMTVNSATGVAYAQDVNVSPQNIHRIQVDTSSGTIVDVGKSNYAGTYSFATPLRLIKNGTVLTSASGDSFVASADPTKDLVYSGPMFNSYHDLASDDALNLLYIADADHKKLVVLNSNGFGAVTSVDLSATPLGIYQTTNSIIVLGQISGQANYYVRSFNKSQLGLAAP
jgi:hypothetical protein